MKKKLFDKRFLIQNFAGDNELIPQIISFYLSTVDEKILQIQESIDSGNTKNFIDACHKLRGSISQFGVISITNKLFKLEESAEKQQLSNLTDSIAEALHLIKELNNELKIFLDKGDFQDSD